MVSRTHMELTSEKEGELCLGNAWSLVLLCVRRANKFWQKEGTRHGQIETTGRVSLSASHFSDHQFREYRLNWWNPIQSWDKIWTTGRLQLAVTHRFPHALRHFFTLKTAQFGWRLGGTAGTLSSSHNDSAHEEIGILLRRSSTCAVQKKSLP